MSGLPEDLRAHLQSGLTTVCRAWALARTDGRVFGFTDHDRTLEFDGIAFKAGTGLSARSLQQGTGLSVDNTEALGALSDASVKAEDIDAGRFDGASVRCWLVNWQDIGQRWLQFRGTIGELRRAGGAFEAELRGLSAALNRPVGRVYQKPCTAVLGDSACGFGLSQPGYRAELAVETIEEGRIFRWEALAGYEPGWFTGGRLTVLSGKGKGLWQPVKRDRSLPAREVELWQPLRAELRVGDLVRLEAGCDKRVETCRLKFNNFINFQGFPDIPGEDWLMTVPRSSNANTGGSRR